MSATIADGKVVSMVYVLTDSEGDVLDQADRNDPFEYLHGAGNIVPGLENELTGLKAGDKKKVTVQPAEGYGELDPQLQLSVKRTQFPAEVQIEAGMEFESRLPDGSSVVFTVTEVEGEMVSVDGNHPLAGETLFFDVEILTIRDATEDEKSHGHAHGPEGHHHH